MIGARYVRNVASAKKLLWTHPMVLPGYELKLKLISVHLEIVFILTQDGCSNYAECTFRHGNHFGHTHWNSKVIWVMWNLASLRSEMVLVSV
jgi:hypothetical protein